jgi:hypothetical protein
MKLAPPPLSLSLSLSATGGFMEISCVLYNEQNKPNNSWLGRREKKEHYIQKNSRAINCSPSHIQKKNLLIRMPMRRITEKLTKVPVALMILFSPRWHK